MTTTTKLLKEGLGHTETANGFVITPKFRVSYPHLFKPSGNKFNDKMKYSISMLFDESEVDLKKLKAFAKSVVADRFGKDYKMPSNFTKPFRQGDERPNDPAYENMVFINCNTERRPAVVNQRNLEINSGEPGDEASIYAGCYARAEVSCYAYGGLDTGMKPGVAFGLRMVQKVDDGEPLGGGAVGNPNDVFAVLDESSDDASNYEDASLDDDDIAF